MKEIIERKLSNLIDKEAVELVFREINSNKEKPMGLKKDEVAILIDIYSYDDKVLDPIFAKINRYLFCNYDKCNITLLTTLKDACITSRGIHFFSRVGIYTFADYLRYGKDNIEYVRNIGSVTYGYVDAVIKNNFARDNNNVFEEYIKVDEKVSELDKEIKILTQKKEELLLYLSYLEKEKSSNASKRTR